MGKVRFKDLEDTDKEYIEKVHADSSLSWDHRMTMLMHRFGISERTARRWIAKLGYSSLKQIENEEIREGRLRKYDTSKKYYILTWAQNDTPVHKVFWDNLLAYADHIDANVGVIQGKYQVKQAYNWDPLLRDYMDGARQTIHPYLDVLADLKVLATAADPLSSLEGISGPRSSIIGHPRVHLRSLPVLKGHPKKLLMTTGACTIKNYTDTKAGKKGEFHHTYGFVVVEIKDDLIYYVRQVTADDDGSFIDLIHSVKDKKVTKVKTCEAFVMGDIHCANVYHPVVEKTVNLFKHIKPKHVVLHDLFDGESVNHHEAKDPIKAFQRYEQGKDILANEVEGLKEFIDRYDLIRYDPILVRSNHDMWLERWINDTDWRKSIPNAKTYIRYAHLLLNGEAPKGIIPYELESHYNGAITTLDLDDSYKIKGWELGHHGHLGSHGSKGNIKQYSKYNTKVIVGDYHQPARRDGAVGVGTYSHLRMGYNKGASAWMHSGAMLHSNGKVQHIIFMEDDNYTTLI